MKTNDSLSERKRNEKRKVHLGRTDSRSCRVIAPRGGTTLDSPAEKHCQGGLAPSRSQFVFCVLLLNPEHEILEFLLSGNELSL